MVRIGTVAGALGAATGIWLVIGVSFGAVAPDRCGVDFCEINSLLRTLVQGFSVVLILGSLASFVGPRKVFYVLALLSAVLGGLLLNAYVNTVAEIGTLGLLVIDLVISLMAARSEFKVSEQSHPMNLPVFG
jgi:hypothetical protein